MLLPINDEYVALALEYEQSYRHSESIRVSNRSLHWHQHQERPGFIQRNTAGHNALREQRCGLERFNFEGRHEILASTCYCVLSECFNFVFCSSIMRIAIFDTKVFLCAFPAGLCAKCDDVLLRNPLDPFSTYEVMYSLS